MITNIRHTGIVVSNLIKSLDFYRKILGFKTIDTGRLFSDVAIKLYNLDTEIDWIKLELQGVTTLELYYIVNKTIRETYFEGFSRLNHFSLTVDNIKKYYNLMRKYGTFVSEEIFYLNRHKVFFARDYDRNLIEFVEPPL